MIALDTSVLVRFLVCDDIEQGGSSPEAVGIPNRPTARLRLPRSRYRTCLGTLNELMAFPVVGLQRHWKISLLPRVS